MRLAVSNIAWDVEEDEAIAQLLARHRVDAIDIAPGKYFAPLAATTDGEIVTVRRWWSDRGIGIIGMQALLFGTAGLNVFGPAEVRAALLAHLRAVCRIGAGLGATRLVFGSPRNRDRSGLGDEETLERALDFFGALGDVAREYGVVFCLEPNPVAYGANFMTTAAETADFVRELGHTAVRMQFDTGAVAMNGEDPMVVLGDCAAIIGHVHLSEPRLVPLGDGGADHRRMAAALRRWLPDVPASIEMVATRDEPHPDSIARALAVADRSYRRASDDGA